MSRLIKIPVLVLVAFAAALAQQSAPASKLNQACGLVEEGQGRPQESPVIFGKPYVVPRFLLQVTDERTDMPVAEREVIVRYVWRWFEYPYPERPFGVWSDAYSLVRCATDKQGFVQVSEFKVEPSGWYKGKLLMGRKPEFTHLDVSVHLEKHITHVRITRDQLVRYKNSKADTIPLRVPLISPLSQ